MGSALGSVNEEEGVVSPCVTLSGATLARSVNITVSTLSVTAGCKQELVFDVYTPLSLFHAAPDDFTGFSNLVLTFEPYSPLTQCVNITIIRDLLVENEEMFLFLIYSDQADEAVVLGSPPSSFITIEDEEEGAN